MTTPRSTLIAIQIADRLSAERPYAIRSGEPHRVTVAVRDLIVDYERTKALEATKIPHTPVSRVHACAVCYPGACRPCGGVCKFPASCGYC